MNKKAALFLSFFLLLYHSGCSSQSWRARWYIFQAESARGKAGQMKDQKVPFEKRLPFYAKSCRYYVKALESGRDVFTLTRIEEATDSCWKANLREEEDVFHAFEEEYSAAHPQEVEHGDAGVSMMEM